MAAPLRAIDPRDEPDESPQRLLTLEEYFAFEDASPVRHEYLDGQVYAMSGVTRRHSTITMNLAGHLWNAARGGPCRVHQAEVKLHIGRIIYYPDVLVACGPEPEDIRVENAPCFVAEVLSPSTRSTDLREKSLNYRQVASLHAFLIIDQDARRVDRYWRDEEGAWQRAVIIGQGEIPLPCPPGADGPLALTLDAIYEGADLPPAAEPRRVREGEAAYAASAGGADV